MKTLDEKAAEYAASVVSCNKEAKECEGLIQTAYILGSMEGELLGEETGTFGQALESLKRGYNVRRKAWVGNGDMFIVKQIDSDISPELFLRCSHCQMLLKRKSRSTLMAQCTIILNV